MFASAKGITPKRETKKVNIMSDKSLVPELKQWLSVWHEENFGGSSDDYDMDCKEFFEHCLELAETVDENNRVKKYQKVA